MEKRKGDLLFCFVFFLIQFAESKCIGSTTAIHMSRVDTFSWGNSGSNVEHVNMNSNHLVLNENLAQTVTHENFMTLI